MRARSFAKQLGSLGKTLGQDITGAVEGGFDVRHAIFRRRLVVDILRRFFLRVEVEIAEQRVGQWLKAGFAGDLRFGAAFRFVGQINIFQRLFGAGAFDGFPQLVGKLALLLDGRQHRRAAVFQLAQVEQPLFKIAQLGVVKIAGRFFAIARDEGHGGAFVQQRHGGRDLMGADAEFACDQLSNLVLGRFGNVLGHELNLVRCRNRMSIAMLRQE